jgi:hypothetical protein
MSGDSIRLNLNNQDYLYPSTNQEEYICDENYNGNEYYDENDDDIISLNVDFTIDDINEEQIDNLVVLDTNKENTISKVSIGAALPPPPPSTRPISIYINKKTNPHNDIKIELNPEKYSLELSTLSSSSSSSVSSSNSKKSLPSIKPPAKHRGK